MAIYEQVSKDGRSGELKLYHTSMFPIASIFYKLKSPHINIICYLLLQSECIKNTNHKIVIHTMFGRAFKVILRRQIHQSYCLAQHCVYSRISERKRDFIRVFAKAVCSPLFWDQIIPIIESDS